MCDYSEEPEPKRARGEPSTTNVTNNVNTNGTNSGTINVTINVDTARAEAAEAEAARQRERAEAAEARMAAQPDLHKKFYFPEATGRVHEHEGCLFVRCTLRELPPGEEPTGRHVVSLNSFNLFSRADTHARPDSRSFHTPDIRPTSPTMVC